MRNTIVVLLLLFCAYSSVLAVGTKEAWVVSGTSRDVTIVDLATETVAAVIPLIQGQLTPEARSIDFSTVDGSGGDFAFVSQGGSLHVVDAGTRSIVNTVNLATQLGFPVTIVDLASAQNREFDTGVGTTVRAFLYAVADAQPGGGQASEPYYIVLDQSVLIGLTVCAPVVHFGPLISPTVQPAHRGEADSIAVLGSPSGDAWQRVWFVTRADTSPALIRSVLLTRALLLTTPWVIDRTIETTLAQGLMIPDHAGVAVPYDREMPVLSTGHDGRLINLDYGGQCDLGGDLRQVAIAGPGPGGYQMLAIDGLTEQIHRVNPVTCAIDSFAVGQDPVALAIDDIGFHGNAYVANRGSDSLSILHLDGTVTDVLLGSSDPIDVGIRKCCPGCTIKTLNVFPAGIPFGIDDFLSWTKTGCLDCGLAVFCQCDVAGDPACPCYCDPDVASAGAGTGGCFENLPPGSGALRALPSTTPLGTGPGTSTPWIHLGNTAGASYTHINVGSYSLKYVVLPITP